MTTKKLLVLYYPSGSTVDENNETVNNQDLAYKIWEDIDRQMLDPEISYGKLALPRLEGVTQQWKLEAIDVPINFTKTEYGPEE